MSRSSCDPRLAAATLGLGLGLGLVACADETAAPPDAGVCDFRTAALFPFEVGFTWTYALSRPPTPGSVEVTRRVTRALDDDGAILQLETLEPGARVVEDIRHDGTAFVRLRQAIHGGDDALVLTRTVEPPALVLDEAPARTAMGATWDESYEQTEVDAVGGRTTTAITDRWTVEAASDLCVAPIGERSCLFLERQRIAGGDLALQLEYAFGLGKFGENGGGRIERLVGCSAGG
jgi:hypothetical protein